MSDHPLTFAVLIAQNLPRWNPQMPSPGEEVGLLCGCLCGKEKEGGGVKEGQERPPKLGVAEAKGGG